MARALRHAAPRHGYLTCTQLAVNYGIERTITTANALVTKILLGVVYLCVPFFYVCNFSLVNRLLSRNVEDIQRLLADVVVLEPDPPESNDWKMLLAEYQRIGNAVFDFELVEQGSKLWNMCAGIKRHLVVLLSTAYREARSAGRKRPSSKMYRRHMARLPLGHSAVTLSC